MAAEELIMLLQNLETVVKNPRDVDAFDFVMLASTLGGMTIGVAYVGLPHAMEHPVSGLHNVVHGQGLAALIPAFMRFNAEHAPAPLAALAVRLGLAPLGGDEKAAALALCVRIEALLDALGLRITLSQLGAKAEDIDWYTENAGVIMNANIENNPAVPTKAQIRALYEASM